MAPPGSVAATKIASRLTFPMSNNADFASKGCTAICHNQDADDTKWWMGTDSADLSLDLWQWQSAATNPVGQATDQYFSAKANPTATTGRANDAIDGSPSAANPRPMAKRR